MFVLKSVIAKFQRDGKGLILSSFDLRKFFDFEDIFDILEELSLSQIKGKIYRLIFHMNKNAKKR